TRLWVNWNLCRNNRFVRQCFHGRFPHVGKPRLHLIRDGQDCGTPGPRGSAWGRPRLAVAATGVARLLGRFLAQDRPLAGRERWRHRVRWGVGSPGDPQLDNAIHQVLGTNGPRKYCLFTFANQRSKGYASTDRKKGPPPWDSERAIGFFAVR